MPLDLPPPLPPQQAEVEILEERHAVAGARDGVLPVEIGQYRLLISGNSYLSEARIREVVTVAKTPSQAILLLNALYSAEGYPFVHVQYAREQDVIYVQVNEGVLENVAAPPLLAPYFAPLKGKSGLREQDLEPARVLAQIESQRAGLQVSSQYQIDPDNPEAFTLQLETEPDPEHDKLRLSAAFGNPGNRFLGRYFGVANAQYYAGNGNLYGLGLINGFTSLGTSRGGESFHRISADFGTVSPLGLYGLSAAYTEYEIRDLFGISGGDREKAQITELKANGNQFLYADKDTRWDINQKIEYVDSTIEFEEPDVLDGITAQDEEYGAARLGSTVSHAWALYDRRGSLSASAGYKRGIGGSIDNNVADRRRTENFDIIDATFSSSYQLPATLLLTLTLNGQLSSDDRLPQQQQWVLGGPDNLSAFLPGVLVGDTGAYGRIQLQLPRWTLFDKPYRFSLFVEHGRAAFENADGQLGRTTSAADAGIKLELAPFDWLEAAVYVADELSSRNVSEQRLEDTEANVFFNLRGRF